MGLVTVNHENKNGTVMTSYGYVITHEPDDLDIVEDKC